MKGSLNVNVFFSFQRKVDDSHSLGSASDSGRGGSDDELNSSRTHNNSGVYKLGVILGT